MQQVLPKPHALWVNSDALEEEPCAANEVGKGLVGDDAFGDGLAEGDGLGLLLVTHLEFPVE